MPNYGPKRLNLPFHRVNTGEGGKGSQAVEVTSSVPVMSEYGPNERDLKKQAAPPQLAASANVTGLRQRVSGVLPVRVDMSETSVTFTCQSK